MKQSFTKLFVAFLALLLTPNWAMADTFTISSTTEESDCQTQFGGNTSYTSSGTPAVLSFGESYEGTTLDLVINQNLEIQIPVGITVSIQSLTCNAAVAVYGGGTLNVSSASGGTVSIGEEGSFTIGKTGQAVPMNVNITNSGTESGDCCVHFHDFIEWIAFTVIGSNVTLTGIPTDVNGFDGEDEDAVASYVDCTVDWSADPITITANSAAPTGTYYFSFGSLENLTEVNSENVDDALENSGLSYDADNNILTVSEGTNIEAICTGNPTGTDVNAGLTINVADDAAVREIQVFGDASITGEGMLTMGNEQGTGANGSIVFMKNANLEITNANITIYKSGASDAQGIYYVDGVETMGLTFDNSNVTISTFGDISDEVGYAIYGLDDSGPTLTDCSITASTPTGTVIWVHEIDGDDHYYYYSIGEDNNEYYDNRVYSLTITRDSEAPADDVVGDVFYTEASVGDGTLKVPYTVLTLAEGATPGTVIFGLDGEDYVSEGASYTGTGQIDFEIPESVTSPNGNTYDIVIGGSMNTPAAFFPGEEISFVKTLTIPATLKKFTDYFLSGIIAKNDELDPPVSGLEKVIFAEGSVQDELELGDQDMAFFTFILSDDDLNPLPSGKVELVVPDSWEYVQNDWGGGDWIGDKVITPIHYAVWINSTDSEEGIEITSLNKDDVLGDGGGVTYNPDTKELTITTDIQRISNGSVGYIDPRPGVDGLKIVIPEGKTVEISMVDVGTYSAIDLINNTVITGGGTLNVSHRMYTCIKLGDFDHGNSIAANLTIKDVTVNVFPIGQLAKGIRFVNHESSLTVSHATLHIENQDGGEDYGEAEDATIIGYAENMPTLINCEITTTPEPAWAVLTGDYYNTGVQDEENLAWGYQVPTLTITAGASSTITAEVEDGSADDVTVDLELLSANKVAIVGVDGTETVTGVMQVPATVTVAGTKMSVTSIADNAFENQSGMTGITLPKTVTSIGAEAFAGCTDLQTVTLQSPFAPTIGTGAFDANANLTVNYPAAAYNNYNDAGWTGVATFQPTVMQPNEWSTICSTQDYTLPEGIEAYIVVGIDYVNSKVQVKKEDGIKAGTPMMIHKTGVAEDYAVTASNITISDTGDQLPTTVADAGTTGAFVGFAPASADETLDIPGESGTDDNQAYILIGNMFVKWTSGTLAPYRCFLWAVDAFTAPSRMAIEVMDEATGVSDVRGKKEDVRNNWYDLSGRRLQSQPTKKGVYIVDGKKIIK